MLHKLLKTIHLILLIGLFIFITSCTETPPQEIEKSVKDETTQELDVYIWASSKNDEIIYFSNNEILAMKQCYKQLNKDVIVNYHIYNNVSKEEFGAYVRAGKDADIILANGNMNEENGSNIKIKTSEQTKKIQIDESWTEMSARYVGIAEICTSLHLQNAIEFREMLIHAKPDKYNEQKVLFIGNSYTYYNDLYKVFDGICKNQGINITTHKVTKASAVLNDYLDTTNPKYTEIVNYLKNNDYNFIFLQEQSSRPITSPAAFEKSVGDLIKLIRSYNKDATIVLYETWARALGNEFYKENPTYTYQQMERELYESYKKVAEKYNCVLSLAGVATYYGYNAELNFSLYQNDLTHPSPEGTYLAALIHAYTCYQIDPLDVTYVPDFQISEGGTNKVQPTEAYCNKLKEIASYAINNFKVEDLYN